ncbi:MAG: LrgB family protein [Burkholderiales bacterium]|nr:LrgB family protein [Burkholderiales bacterium]
MSRPEFFELWVYLAASPLLGLTLTLVAYQVAHAAYIRLGFHPLANPVPIAIALIVAVLAMTGTDYKTYFDGAQFVHFLLGPAIVALAVPLYENWPRLRQLAAPLAVGLTVGAATAVATTLLLAHAFGLPDASRWSLAAKSVTAPIAMGIAEQIGGLPALAAVFAIATGIIGAALGKFVLDACRIADPAARGFAIGLAAHGIGTARAYQVSEVTGAFAGLALGLHGLLASFALPPLLRWIG